MDTESALHAAARDAPLDQMRRLVLSDFYADRGMHEESLAHAWLGHGPGSSGGVKPPTTFREWSLQTDGLDGSRVATAMSRAATNTSHAAHDASKTADSESKTRRAEHLAGAGQVSQLAANAMFREGQHAGLSSNHESLANGYESDSYFHDNEPAADRTRKRHNAHVANVHRVAQDHHMLASQVHGWHERVEWDRRRGAE